jgi:sulfur-carrier protein
LHKKCSCRGHFSPGGDKDKKDFVSCNFIPNFISRENRRDKEVAPDKKVVVSVTVYIPQPLREFTEGHTKVEIEESPETLAGALSALWILFPALRDRIATEQGEIREHINIFIGDENARFTGGLASRIPAGTEISIVPSISGG